MKEKKKKICYAKPTPKKAEVAMSISQQTLKKMYYQDKKDNFLMTKCWFNMN